MHLTSGAPLFLAALAAPTEGRQLTPTAGFALVSADAEGGMVDIHDRRPISLSAQDALQWLDPGLTPQRALQLAHSAALGPETFAWHAVQRDMRPPARTSTGHAAASAPASAPAAQLELPL